MTKEELEEKTTLAAPLSDERIEGMNAVKDAIDNTEVKETSIKNTIADNELTNTSKLTPSEMNTAKELASKIDMGDGTALTLFGSESQKDVEKFSQGILDTAASKDSGDVGNLLVSLMSELNKSDPIDLTKKSNNFFSRLFHNVQDNIVEKTAKYKSIGANLDVISGQLEQSSNGLIKDYKMLDGLYNENLKHFKSLNVYIEAGKIKQKELNEKLIPEMKAKVENSKDPMALQNLNDLTEATSQLEKRIYDLELTRQVVLLQGPEIRRMQNNSQKLASKINSSILTTVPIWKNQIAVALTNLHQDKANSVMEAVDATTNDLLIKNADMLNQSAIETAKINERGVVDIETIAYTQDKFLETLDSVLEIQKEGHKSRIDSEKKLADMEEKFHQGLLNYSNVNSSMSRKDITKDAVSKDDEEQVQEP